MLCAYRLPFIIYLLSQPLCFQWISDNRKAGKYPASLCNGVDESDRAYVMKIVSATGGKIKPADIRPDLAPLFNASNSAA